MSESGSKTEENTTSLVNDSHRVHMILEDLEDFNDFTNPDELYDILIERVKKYHPSDDVSLIKKAYELAVNAHKDQRRKSGEPYIIHPLCVAIILADLQMDKETIISGLLHDIIEDTDTTPEELTAMFGQDVTNIVEGVTKLAHLTSKPDKVEEQGENLRKMFLAMAKDIRVIIVKLADRLHNMRTLGFMTPAKQKEKARETLEIYSPLAQRLGIAALKIELDDLSLKYLEPEAFDKLVKELRDTHEHRQQFVDAVVREIKYKVEEAGIHATVKGRVKHFFSIYRKMVNQGKTIDQIYDLFAVRVIVDSIRDCYAVLGIIHEMYTPVPERFKDYIAMPKANMYQSIHNTLIGPGGRPFEVQIRTKEMDRVAEYGIAAHWKYKEASDGKKTGPEQEEEKLNWLRQILEWQKETDNNQEFLSILKSDLNLFNNNVYCFSPAGDVKSLPADSCTIDFAYAVHSAVGNKMVGARINGKLVPIETKIHNGDRVEIITSQNSKGPSRDWLKVVKSSQARNRINHWFRNESKEDNIQKGHDMLQAYAKTKNINLGLLTKPEYQQVVLNKYGFKDWNAVLAALGHGALREGQVFNKLFEAYERERRNSMTDDEVLENTMESISSSNKNTQSKGGIIVQGADDVAVKFGKCCSPIPGDEIVGFVTRGRGITIHRTDCVNMINLPKPERERLIEAEWQKDESGSRMYLVEISIFSTNRTGLLADISRLFTENKIDIKALNVRTSKQGTANFDIGFEVNNTEELTTFMNRLQQIEGIIDITRTRG